MLDRIICMLKMRQVYCFGFIVALLGKKLSIHV